MQDWLSATALVRPDGVALISDSRTWTYRDLNEQVTATCTHWLVASEKTKVSLR